MQQDIYFIVKMNNSLTIKGTAENNKSRTITDFQQ